MKSKVALATVGVEWFRVETSDFFDIGWIFKRGEILLPMCAITKSKVSCIY